MWKPLERALVNGLFCFLGNYYLYLILFITFSFSWSTHFLSMKIITFNFMQKQDRSENR